MMSTNHTDEEHPERRPVIVGVDGSDASIDALQRAARISSRLDLPLKVVSVWQYPLMFGTYVPDVNWYPQEDAKAAVQATIDAAFEDELPRDMSTCVRKGTPAHVLIEESQHAEMLVLGSRGHGGFAGLILGSVSSACAEHAHCPVLIVHSDRAETTAG
jgi:nucleotide-binding universal stress UspA family protein